MRRKLAVGAFDGDAADKRQPRYDAGHRGGHADAGHERAGQRDARWLVESGDVPLSERRVDDDDDQRPRRPLRPAR